MALLEGSGSACPHDVLGELEEEEVVAVEPWVRFEVEADALLDQPVDLLALDGGIEVAVIDGLTVVLDIGTVAANHTVEPHLPNGLVHLGLAASRACIDAVARGARRTNRRDRKLGDGPLASDERHVNVQEDDLARHVCLLLMCQGLLSLP